MGIQTNALLVDAIIVTLLIFRVKRAMILVKLISYMSMFLSLQQLSSLETGLKTVGSMMFVNKETVDHVGLSEWQLSSKVALQLGANKRELPKYNSLLSK